MQQAISVPAPSLFRHSDPTIGLSSSEHTSSHANPTQTPGGAETGIPAAGAISQWLNSMGIEPPLFGPDHIGWSCIGLKAGVSADWWPPRSRPSALTSQFARAGYDERPRWPAGQLLSPVKAERSLRCFAGPGAAKPEKFGLKDCSAAEWRAHGAQPLRLFRGAIGRAETIRHDLQAFSRGPSPSQAPADARTGQALPPALSD